MTVHDFKSSLAKSHAQEAAPWWEEVYRRAFPDFDVMTSVRKDGWAQRGGIDRVITLTSGKVVTVDEKVRTSKYDDVLLEYWSDEERRIRGWVAKELACDYIAYAFVPSKTCYLLPALQLRRAWRDHGRHWVETCRRVEARNRGAGGGEYVTVSVAVPTEDLFLAIESAMRVQWGAL